MMNSKAFKKMALLGLLGGIFYQIGDYFLFLHPDYIEGLLPQKCWDAMPMWVFSASMWCALLGSVGLVFGFYSLYTMVKKTCGKPWRVLTILSLPGVLGVLYAHFVIGCLQPMLYKSMTAAGMSDTQFLAVNAGIMPANMSLTVFAIVSFYFQLVVILYGIISKRFRLPKYAITTLVLIVIGLCVLFALSLFLPESLSGIAGGFESLFEGVMYLVPYFYWSREQKAGNAALKDKAKPKRRTK